MRKVTRNAITAFLNYEAGKFGNTEVRVERLHGYDIVSLYLHGNCIATIGAGELTIRTAGWQSNVTKERLNALPNVSIQQKKGISYLNGKEWDGSWIKVDANLS